MVRPIADRLWAGRPTAADEAFLRRYPQVAAALPDGRTVHVGVEVVAAPGLPNGTMAASTSCHYADRYMNVNSPLGFRLYSYHTVLSSWCENGTSILSSVFSDYFNNVDGTAMTNPRPGLIHQLKKPAANHWVAYTGGAIDNCIFRVGCLGTKYPAQQISHYAGRGSTTYQWYFKDDSSGWHHQ